MDTSRGDYFVMDTLRGDYFAFAQSLHRPAFLAFADWMSDVSRAIYMRAADKSSLDISTQGGYSEVKIWIFWIFWIF